MWDGSSPPRRTASRYFEKSFHFLVEALFYAPCFLRYYLRAMWDGSSSRYPKARFIPGFFHAHNFKILAQGNVGRQFSAAADCFSLL
jgi:hypothetical protein